MGVRCAQVLDALARRGKRAAALLAVLAALTLPATAEAQNTALSAITVNGVSIPGFLATDDVPQYGVSAVTTTAAIVATAEATSATVSYSGTDADDTTADVHDVMLSDGANTVTITVTDGSDSDTYELSVNRAVTTQYGWKADDDFDTLKLADNNTPRGIWYDAATATVYVCDLDADKVYAYNPDGTRDSGKDFDVSSSPNGIWSDGTTLWVADNSVEKLLAYTLASRTANSAENFDTLDTENQDPRDLWSDGTTMWVVDKTDKKIYAYKLSDKSRATRARTSTRSTPPATTNPGPSGRTARRCG